MKILLLTQVLPYPPDSGPKVKTWNVIKYLAQRHELTLVSFVRGDQSASILHLEAVCQAVYTVPIQRGALLDAAYMALSFLTGQPFLIIRDDRRAMRALIDRLADQEQFDIVHADQLNMAQYACRVRGARQVLDAHNAVWLLYKRLAATMPWGVKRLLLERDWRLLKQYEGQVCEQFDGVIAVSQEDREALEEAAGGPFNLEVVPIAVDTNEVPLIPRNLPAGGAAHILHMGTMYWPPNVDGILWFLREVLPLIRQQAPEVVFDVLGANPPREVLAYGEADPNIRVMGYVDDPQPYVEQAGVSVVPLRAGGGMRVKILNSLAQGLPVVSTTLGAEGIAVVAGKHLLIADSPAEFARAVLRLLNDPKRAAALGRAGRELVVTRYDYRVTGKAVEELYLRSKDGIKAAPVTPGISA